ncbi:MAG TPA: DUF1931 family protein [Pseudonocardiaceae bacterium]|jgi:hypothetical protein
MTIMGVARFRHFFRAAAEIDVDRNDLKRYSDFVNDKIYDLVLMAQPCAKANGRDVIIRTDLPITKGLQESIHRFEKLDQEIELEPILAQLTARPPLENELDEQTTAWLPTLAGGLSIALATTLTIIAPDAKAAHSLVWERAFEIFDVVL